MFKKETAAAGVAGQGLILENSEFAGFVLGNWHTKDICRE